jgi:fumarate hydratase class I
MQIQEIVELYRKTATELPEDIVLALKDALRQERGIAKNVLENIINNTKKARLERRPICQDTGTPIFYIKHSKTRKKMIDIINKATKIATKKIPLRPNAVDPITGKVFGNRPIIHFDESGESKKVDLMLKGGGSENISCIYQLPSIDLNAERNLDGVRKCVLDAVFRAQGKGCPPYIIGVAIGGQIEEVAYLAKKQLLRKLDDCNKIKELDEFESTVLNDINKLGIGPLGLGGRTTALGVKIISTWRHPASFFVGISFGCWCLRRQSL